MENQDYKILEIEVGVDYPDVGLDDTFEIQLKLYENEIQSIVEKGKKELWVFGRLCTNSIQSGQYTRGRICQ